MSVRQVQDSGIIPSLPVSSAGKVRPGSDPVSDFTQILRGTLAPSSLGPSFSRKVQEGPADVRPTGRVFESRAPVRSMSDRSREVESADFSPDSGDSLSEGDSVNPADSREARDSILPRVREEGEFPEDERLQVLDPRDSALEAAALQAAAARDMAAIIAASAGQPADASRVSNGTDGLEHAPDQEGSSLPGGVAVAPGHIRQLLRDAQQTARASELSPAEDNLENPESVSAASFADPSNNVRVVASKRAGGAGMAANVNRPAAQAHAERTVVIPEKSSSGAGNFSPIPGSISGRAAGMAQVSVLKSQFVGDGFTPQVPINQQAVKQQVLTVPLVGGISQQPQAEGESLLTPSSLSLRAPAANANAREENIQTGTGLPMDSLSKSALSSAESAVNTPLPHELSVEPHATQAASPALSQVSEKGSHPSPERTVKIEGAGSLPQGLLTTAQNGLQRSPLSNFQASGAGKGDREVVPHSDKSEHAPSRGTQDASEGIREMQPPVISTDLADFSANSESGAGQQDSLASDGNSRWMMDATAGAGLHPATQTAALSPVARPAAVEMNRAEFWDQVREMVQRVRSENPSHLAVEVRLPDGSAVGIELRMRPTGLEASFRSESPALLRGLESQWAAFLAKDAPSLQIANAAFENRSSLGNFGDSGRNGRELREQMEDNAANAALADRRNSGSGNKPRK